jgi:hypothetical protein
MFMQEEEQSGFERILLNAFEDLINTRPEDPINHFCKSLLSFLPIEDMDKAMFQTFRNLGLETDKFLGTGETAGEGVTRETPMNSLPLPPVPRRRGIGYLGSVAGESLNKDELAWNPISVEKTAEEKEFLRPILKKNLLLSNMSDQNLEAVIEVLELVTGEDGFHVVEEGDIGDGCFIVQEGRLLCVMNTGGLRCEYGPVSVT